MSKFLDFFRTIGEKSGRNDIWVILISIMFLTCLFGPVFNVNICANNMYVNIILGGMFADLGISNLTKAFGK